MKTYGRPTRRFAMANVRTHALTKKATLLAQRLARRRVNVKMKNLTTSQSRPARKVRENNSSQLLKLPLISKKGSFDKSQLLKPQNKYFIFIFANSVLKALANEDTLLRTHCCRHKCFPVCPRAQQLLQTQILCPGHKKCF